MLLINSLYIVQKTFFHHSNIAIFQRILHKANIYLMLSGIIFYSCGSEDPVQIETFSTEAFAFDIGDRWEVNAATRVKGFNQVEEENNFSATIAYEIDLVTPAGDTLKALISRVEDKTGTERIMDIPLEVQFELDSTYAEGEYIIVFNIKDALSNNTASASANFNIVDE